MEISLYCNHPVTKTAEKMELSPLRPLQLLINSRFAQLCDPPKTNENQNTPPWTYSSEPAPRFAIRNARCIYSFACIGARGQLRDASLQRTVTACAKLAEFLARNPRTIHRSLHPTTRIHIPGASFVRLTGSFSLPFSSPSCRLHAALFCHTNRTIPRPSPIVYPVAHSSSSREPPLIPLIALHARAANLRSRVSLPFHAFLDFFVATAAFNRLSRVNLIVWWRMEGGWRRIGLRKLFLKI